ncbi:hypothetical protein [Flavobacterium sp. MDT1-60]|uniref:hypothetical protein n=1 Tax=Flavobacterium sp. MDT1-60 TaxID=1979344 RepID=UPI00177AAF5C|nr:hypothetical protein [Flavobacterium sp. MDT1-60]QOG04763.1 hypothetical protein IHE43_11465 [Flavobacterium sp. MDT1-60]
MEIKYILELNGIIIGYTEFEFADPPMGVVHGKIIFDEIDSPYDFFKNHCKKFNVQINTDFPNEKFIDTAIIPQLKVFLQNENQLHGWGGAISGMDSDEFEIQFGGISSELMQTEFKHHYIRYYKHE